ncbi:MAG: ArsR/SmtB family transcription factor [Tepidisphaeraceae bacterium]
MFRACSDPTRLRILCLLGSGEMCVCDVVAALRMSQPKVSRHLAYLRRAGLVRARRQGLWMHYSLVAARDAMHRNLLACVSCCCFVPVSGNSRTASCATNSKSCSSAPATRAARKWPRPSRATSRAT